VTTHVEESSFSRKRGNRRNFREVTLLENFSKE